VLNRLRECLLGSNSHYVMNNIVIAKVIKIISIKIMIVEMLSSFSFFDKSFSNTILSAKRFHIIIKIIVNISDNLISRETIIKD